MVAARSRTLRGRSDAAGSSFFVLPSIIAAYLRGELDLADRYLSEFIERSRRYGVQRIQSTIIAVSWIVGVRAYLIDDSRWVEEAIAFRDKYGETPWRAHYLFELALHLPPSERMRAERHVQEATREAQRLELKPLLQRIGREWSPAVDHAERTAATAAGDSVHTAGITRRECQILDCLVEGLTNKEIAATLNISPYTVGNHLRNIYAKTQSANRGEAVHWALANHLSSANPAESTVNREGGG